MNWTHYDRDDPATTSDDADVFIAGMRVGF